MVADVEVLSQVHVYNTIPCTTVAIALAAEGRVTLDEGGRVLRGIGVGSPNTQGLTASSFPLVNGAEGIGPVGQLNGVFTISQRKRVVDGRNGALLFLVVVVGPLGVNFSAGETNILRLIDPRSIAFAVLENPAANGVRLAKHFAH